MKNKIKNKLKTFFQCYLPGFILGIISACTISVIAATYFPSNQTTYDNTNTELKSENVQDAIDELYGVCFPPKAGDQIIENAGLEKDPYECRYFFTGATPNNYITFNDEQAGWRIISVECDGRIKIMREAHLGIRAWDSSNSNNWARPASLNTYLNNKYYNSLSPAAESQVVTSDFSIGGIDYSGNVDMQTLVNQENSSKWNGKVALVTVSEYLRSNSNKNSCGTLKIYHNNYTNCKNSTWMTYSNYDLWWILTPYYETTSNAIFISLDGFIGTGGASNISPAPRPALYLSSDITLTGTGTSSDPYVVNS